MASLSELCRGLSVPSIDITPIATTKHLNSFIRFNYPYSKYKWGDTRFNYASMTPYILANKLLNKWVKLSHSLERKTMGYVSIKLIF